MAWKPRSGFELGTHKIQDNHTKYRVTISFHYAKVGQVFESLRHKKLTKVQIHGFHFVLNVC